MVSNNRMIFTVQLHFRLLLFVYTTLRNRYRLLTTVKLPPGITYYGFGVARADM